MRTNAVQEYIYIPHPWCALSSALIATQPPFPSSPACAVVRHRPATGRRVVLRVGGGHLCPADREPWRSPSPPRVAELSVLLRLASRFRRRLRRARVMIVARVLLPRPHAHGLLSLRAAAGDEEGLLPTYPGRRVPASSRCLSFRAPVGSNVWERHHATSKLALPARGSHGSLGSSKGVSNS